MHIASLQNPRIKEIVKLRDDKRERARTGLMLVEGWDEINLAMSAGFQAQTLLTAPDLASRGISPSGADTLTVDRAVFEKISHRENPDGWLAIFPIPKVTLADLHIRATPLLVVAESIEKPGNLGAILRTADSAGVDAMLVCDRRVDIYNPNVIRASRGTLFTVPTVETSNEAALSFLQNHGIRPVAATPGAEAEYTQPDLRGPLAIVVGTEDEGLTEFWLRACDLQVRIPMRGRVNSLNVSIAAALIVYEVLRQRSYPPEGLEL